MIDAGLVEKRHVGGEGSGQGCRGPERDDSSFGIGQFLLQSGASGERSSMSLRLCS